MTHSNDKKLVALGAAFLFGLTIVTAGLIGVQPRTKQTRPAAVDASTFRHASAERKIAALEFEESDKGSAVPPTADSSAIIRAVDLYPQPNERDRPTSKFRIALHLLESILQL